MAGFSRKSSLINLNPLGIPGRIGILSPYACLSGMSAKEADFYIEV